MSRLLIFATIIALPALGCVREIDIENLPANVTSVGALSLDGQQNVVVPYTVRDFEGDDQVVTIDICDAPGSECGAAAAAFGGDPLNRVTAVPKDTDVLHEFRWQPWCGRWKSQLETVELDDSFVVAVWVLSSDSDPVYSEPTSLAQLGAIDGTCD